ncbi:MAG: septum formation family protein [Actinotalea sp.]|nr:septum formation family protein [Actinotalea sp.]
MTTPGGFASPAPGPSTPPSGAPTSRTPSSGGAPPDAPSEPYYVGWSPPTAPPPPRRRGLHRTGARVLAVVGALALVAVVVVGARTWADSRPLGDPRGEVSAHPRQLVVGHCLQVLPPDGTVRRVTILPCAEPHEAEVLSRHRHADQAWPGATAVRREAEAACEMDATQQAAGVLPVVWTPTEASWRQGDRESLCLAWLPGSGLRGSWTDGDVRLP